MTLFGLLRLLLIGAIAGVLAKFFYPQRRRMDWPDTIGLGVAGSVFGGWIGQLLHMGSGKPGGIFTATIGALLLLFLYNRFIVQRRR